MIHVLLILSLLIIPIRDTAIRCNQYVYECDYAHDNDINTYATFLTDGEYYSRYYISKDQKTGPHYWYITAPAGNEVKVQITNEYDNYYSYQGYIDFKVYKCPCCDNLIFYYKYQDEWLFTILFVDEDILREERFEW